MSFLNDKIKESSTPKRPTRAAQANLAADRIKTAAVQSVMQFAAQINETFQIVWQNPDGLTPQEVCDALGTDALEVFASHKATVEFLVSQASDIAKLMAKVPEGYTVTYEMDSADPPAPTGRVTIVDENANS